MLTLRRFVDVGFAILVEEYQRLGVDLLSALEKVGLLGATEEEKLAAELPKPVDNAKAMEQLMGMMGGVKGAPLR